MMLRGKKHRKKSNEEKKPLKTDENTMVSLNKYDLFLQIENEVVSL